MRACETWVLAGGVAAAGTTLVIRDSVSHAWLVWRLQDSRIWERRGYVGLRVSQIEIYTEADDGPWWADLRWISRAVLLRI